VRQAANLGTPPHGLVGIGLSLETGAREEGHKTRGVHAHKAEEGHTHKRQRTSAVRIKTTKLNYPKLN
jgi:hypothetical protein